jgi:hypothetical protein
MFHERARRLRGDSTSRGPMMLSHERSATSSILFAAAVVAGVPSLAHADDDLDVPETPPPASAARAAETGAFLPSALSATSEGRRGLAMGMGGWNQNRRGGMYDTTAEAQLQGPISLYGGVSYDGPDTDVSPHIELRVDALRQARHGVDLAVAAGYSGTGFNTVPAALLKVAVGRNLGATYLLANVIYEQGLEQGERSGELRLAALYPVTQSASVGLDSRFEIDLERDADEPEGETDWESRSGVVGNYVWNRIVFSGMAGLSSLKFRVGGPVETGAILSGGVGMVF